LKDRDDNLELLENNTSIDIVRYYVLKKKINLVITRIKIVLYSSARKKHNIISTTISTL